MLEGRYGYKRDTNMKKLSDFHTIRSANTELIKRVSSLMFIEVGDGVYDILGDVDFGDLGLSSLLEVTALLKELTSSKISVRIRKVQGNFNCSDNNLTDLKGAPEYVKENFKCYSNKLGTLEGAPKYVGGHFWCDRNNLKNLIGAPQYIGKGFYCSFNQLVSLEGAPKRVEGGFDCSTNQLQTLQGAPEYVGSDFDCSDNALVSLEGAPKYVGGVFECGFNPKEFTVEEVRKLVNVGGGIQT